MATSEDASLTTPPSPAPGVQGFCSYQLVTISLQHPWFNQFRKSLLDSPGVCYMVRPVRHPLPFFHLEVESTAPAGLTGFSLALDQGWGQTRVWVPVEQDLPNCFRYRPPDGHVFRGTVNKSSQVPSLGRKWQVKLSCPSSTRFVLGCGLF